MSCRVGSRHLLQFALLAAATAVFASPVAAQGQPDGERVLLGFGGAVVLVLSLCGILAIFLSDYTRRTTDRALADIGPVLKSGFIVTGVLLLPFLTAVVVNLLLDGLGIVALAVFGILGPLLVVPVAGSGLGFLVLARAVSDHWLVVAVVIAFVAGLIGAGVAIVPTLLLAALPLAAVGIGAMIHEWRARSPTAQGKRRKPHPWEHRRP